MTHSLFCLVLDLQKAKISDTIKGMRDLFEEKLIRLANLLPKPLYAVGGVVRNFLIDKSLADDIDLASANSSEDMAFALNQLGFVVIAEYKRTGTIVFKGEKGRYEYTTFRREEYALGGAHTPILTEFTDSIEQDALRRDFKCNAVYYDIKNDCIVDVLGGVSDIKNKILDTVTNAEKVFKSDGLRLLRLARFCGELNFKPTKQVLSAMQTYADNILDISPERILEEFKRIFVCDTKYPFSDKKGHYNALKILADTLVLDRIIPELTNGRGVIQNQTYHKYDVLEHSLKSVLYAPQGVRFVCLLHDVGKPFCLERDDNFYQHAIEGAKLAEKILLRLKADNKSVGVIKRLVKYHMLDLDLKMREVKIKRFMAENLDILQELFLIKQADFSASKDNLSLSPTVEKWKNILAEMKESGVPLSCKELDFDSKLLIDLGLSGKEIGNALKTLFDYALTGRVKNDRAQLQALAQKLFEKN